MLSSSVRTASRSSAATTISRAAVRRVARVRVPQRCQSTSSSGPQASTGSFASHAAAGVAGGAAVFVAAYGYYHFSGAKKAVDTTKLAHQSFQQMKATIAEKAPKSPSEALQFLRSVAKSYAGLIPGGTAVVDSSFEVIDQLHDTHGEELNKILQGAYDDVSAVIKDLRNKDDTVSLDTATAGKLVQVLGKRIAELNELAKKAGSDTFSTLEKKYPMVAQAIGSSYGELKGLAQRGGPEARKLVEESIGQVQDLLKDSTDSTEAWSRARGLVQDKAQRLKEIIWAKAAEEAKGNDELEKLLKENKDTFIKSGASLASLKAVIERVHQAASDSGFNQEKMKELKDFVQGKAQEAQSKGWETLQEWVKAVPGGDEALKKMSDIDLQSLMKISQERSGDAKQLAEETYRDILKVLQEKAGKAKKIVDEGKEQAKPESK